MGGDSSTLPPYRSGQLRYHCQPHFAHTLENLYEQRQPPGLFHRHRPN